MTITVKVQRVPPSPTEPSGHCRVGFAACDFTPPSGIAMAGYSTDGQRGKVGQSRLLARALYAEDATGRKVALVVLDLMSASRYLWERVATRTAARVGITRENLILCATHTHTAPGHFYGNALYDHLAQCRSGFDQALANQIAERAAKAITQAHDEARPARLGVAETEIWGLTRNASPNAFSSNPEAKSWPGGKPDLSVAQRAIDPRLTVLSAVDESGVFGSLAIFAGHNTALGSSQREYDPDWNGVACELASQELGAAMLSPGAGGDLNTLHEDRSPGVELARHVGKEVAAAWVRTARQAERAAAPFEVELRFGTLDRTQATVDKRSDTELDHDFVFGVPALAGGEEGRTLFYRVGLARPGHTSEHFAESHPQHPKAPALGRLQGWYRGWRELDLAPEFPLHVLDIGGLTLGTVPGEPTVVVGQRIEHVLAKPGQHARVLGYAGDYLGYVTTAEEFSCQDYEAASTLLGRHQARHIQARLKQIAESEPPTPARGAAVFQTISAIEHG